MVNILQMPPLDRLMHTCLGNEFGRQARIMQRLSDYIESDDAGAIEDLLEDQTDFALIVAAIKGSVYSPLHYAAAHRKEGALDVLLKTLPIGVWHVRSQDRQCTPFMLAAEQGHSQFARDLHERLISATVACILDTQRADAVQTLKAEFECPPDTADAPSSDARVVFNSVWTSINNATDVDGNTAAHLAFKNEQFGCCYTLITWGASPRVQNHKGESVKSLAAELPKDSDLYGLLHGREQKQAQPAALPVKGESKPYAFQCLIL
jgi:hypothetical protein